MLQGELVRFFDQSKIVVGAVFANLTQQVAKLGNGENVGSDLLAESRHDRLYEKRDFRFAAHSARALARFSRVAGDNYANPDQRSVRTNRQRAASHVRGPRTLHRSAGAPSRCGRSSAMGPCFSADSAARSNNSTPSCISRARTLLAAGRTSSSAKSARAACKARALWPPPLPSRSARLAIRGSSSPPRPSAITAIAATKYSVKPVRVARDSSPTFARSGKMLLGPQSKRAFAWSTFASESYSPKMAARCGRCCRHFDSDSAVPSAMDAST